MARPLPSRKRVALRRIAVMAAVLMFANSILHLGLLLPRQARLTIEERKGTGWTRTVETRWEPELHPGFLTYLSQNESVTMLSNVYFTHLGWFPGFGNALDCSGEEPLYVGCSYLNRDERAVWYFFGRIDDPKIQRIEIALYAEEYDSMSHAYTGREVRRVMDVEILEESGRRYFLARDDGEWDYERDNSPRPEVAAYAADGTELLRMKIQHWNSSHYG